MKTGANFLGCRFHVHREHQTSFHFLRKMSNCPVVQVGSIELVHREGMMLWMPNPANGGAATVDVKSLSSPLSSISSQFSSIIACEVDSMALASTASLCSNDTSPS